MSSVGAASSAAPTGNIVVALKNINNGNHYRINHHRHRKFLPIQFIRTYKKVKEWSWESFWLLQGVFAWLVFPLLGALLGIPQGSSLFDLWGTGGAPMSIFYGILWGVGGLTFGLSMRYLGVALGQSIALGTCAGFGTLFPAIFAGTNLFEGNGLILLLGVCITLSGIAIIGYAGSLRAKT